MKYHWPLLILFSFGLVSCSSIQSGHYVQIKKGEGLKELAHAYGVTQGEIRAANPKKSFHTGQWVYVPLRRGLNYYFGGQRSIASGHYAAEKGQMMWPVPSSRRISSYFGRRGSRPHEGIDIPARSGSHILASAEGKVIYSAAGIRGYGNMIVLSHGNQLYTVYAHNRKNLVKKGDRVFAGQVIGQVGSTGRSSGPHLHFEVREAKKSVDPLAYLTGRPQNYARR